MQIIEMTYKLFYHCYDYNTNLNISNIVLDNRERGNQISVKLAGNNHLLTDTRLTDRDAEALYKTLRNNVYVTSLDLRYNNLTDEGAQHIAKLIEVWMIVCLGFTSL